MKVKFLQRRYVRSFQILFILLIIGCYSFKNLRPDVEYCSLIERIIEHEEVVKTLNLNIYKKANIRVFILNDDIKCSGVALESEWNFKTYTKIRPSINTGYHRDIFIDFKGAREEIKVYLASHEHDKNRQTTYLLEFKDLNGEIELEGFSEYTDDF